MHICTHACIHAPTHPRTHARTSHECSGTSRAPLSSCQISVQHTTAHECMCILHYYDHLRNQPGRSSAPTMCLQMMRHVQKVEEEPQYYFPALCAGSTADESPALEGESKLLWKHRHRQMRLHSLPYSSSDRKAMHEANLRGLSSLVLQRLQCSSCQLSLRRRECVGPDGQCSSS